MTVKAVIFDFGGVIVPGSPSVDDPESLWSRLERQHGLPGGSLWRAFYLENSAWLQLRVGDSSFEEWRAVSLSNVAALANETAAAEVVAMVWDSRERAGAAQDPSGPLFNPGMVELVRSLRERFKVSLLSNAAPGLEDDLRGHYGIYELFHDVINSATVRLAKPDTRIFHLAAERLGLTPPDCFFIDDLAHNVEAARGAGMRAHQFLGYDGLAVALREAGVLEPVR